MKEKIKKMSDEELLDKYNEYRHRADKILANGGMGILAVSNMFELLDEIYKRQDR